MGKQVDLGLPRSDAGRVEDINPVEAFINPALAEADLAPAAPAEARTLIRRVTYDLTGLPPTPGEVDQFQQDWEQDPPQAWTTLVDRLLGSPHYSERSTDNPAARPIPLPLRPMIATTGLRLLQCGHGRQSSHLPTPGPGDGGRPPRHD